ncbi:MAG: hypothetical protein AMXMBFR79_07640 [Chitinophagaceae bacterium]
MRFIKLGVISFIVLFFIFTAIGLLLPSTVVVSRAIDITAQQDTVFNKMKNIYEWKIWIAGMNKPEVKIISEKEADLFGTKVIITAVKEYAVFSNWISKKNNTQESIMRVIHNNNSPQITVQWQFTEKLKWYPWQRFSSLMNESITGKQLENNLAALKKIVEEK